MAATAVIVVLGASMVAVLVVLRKRPSHGAGHRSPLAWRHHLGCSLADSGSTSATIFLASDLCISINHEAEVRHRDLAPAAEPATCTTGPAPQQINTSRRCTPEDAEKQEILLLERLWEMSSDADDDRP